MLDPEKKPLTQKKVSAKAEEPPKQTCCDQFLECLKSFLEVKNKLN